MTFKKASKTDFNRIYELLSLSFPTTEFRTKAGQEALFEKEQYRVLMGEDGNSVIAYWDFGDFLYGEHFAVDPSLRGRGYGAKMLDYFIKNAGKPIVLEAEPPENEIASRRIAFYERMGFVLNYYPYIQPSIRPGENPIPLNIMSYPQGISQEAFNQVRQVLFQNVYNVGI